MATLREWIVRLWGTFRQNPADRDLEQELRSHLELAAEEARRGGRSPEGARRMAAVQAGGVAQAMEALRDQRGLFWLEDLARDIRYMGRSFRQSPGFWLAVVLTLGLGIGANTAVFSVFNTVLLRPLPYQDPDHIVSLASTNRVGIQTQITDADLLDWRSQATTFDAVTYYAVVEVPVTTNEQAEYVDVSRVSGDFFNVFAVRPIVGRLFDAEELKPGGSGAVVVSYAFAQRQFGGSTQALGRTIRFVNRAVSIVGVAPPSFSFPEGTEVWVPLVPGNNLSRSRLNFLGVGRLKNGVSLLQAQSELAAIARRLEQEYPDTNTGRGIVVRQLQDQMVGDVRLMLYVLLAAVGVVLLIACTNLATLLLARATARAQEITVRVALGASRGRIARQMLAECLVQGLAAGAFGLLLALGGMQALVAVIPADLPRITEITIDGRVLLFAFATSMVASVFLALAPAFQASRVQLNGGLRQGGTRSIVGGTRRVREALVVTQIAMAVVLLAGGGLLIRSFIALQDVALGFQSQNVLVMDATVVTADPKQPASLFFRDLLAELSHVPGVVAAGATMAPPGRADATGFYFIDRVPEASELHKGSTAVSSIVAPGTFATLGIPLLDGRDFNEHDVRDAPMTAIVNQTLARRALPGRDIVGHKVICGFDTLEPMTIVGVVGDVHQWGPAREPQPECYMPYLQHFYNGSKLSVVIRTAADPMALAETVRRKAQELTPAVPVRFTTLDALMMLNVDQPRFRAMLIGIFAGVALLLALIGIFGVMAYVVSQRTREIGMRLALGATRGHIVGLFLGRGVALTMAGLSIGLVGAVAASRTYASLLFATEPTDPTTYVFVSLLLGSTALLALYLPARRAARIDPLVALRCE